MSPLAFGLFLVSPAVAPPLPPFLNGLTTTLQRTACKTDCAVEALVVEAEVRPVLADVSVAPSLVEECVTNPILDEAVAVSDGRRIAGLWTSLSLSDPIQPSQVAAVPVFLTVSGVPGDVLAGQVCAPDPKTLTVKRANKMTVIVSSAMVGTGNVAGGLTRGFGRGLFSGAKNVVLAKISMQRLGDIVGKAARAAAPSGWLMGRETAGLFQVQIRSTPPGNILYEVNGQKKIIALGTGNTFAVTRLLLDAMRVQAQGWKEIKLRLCGTAKPPLPPGIVAVYLCRPRTKLVPQGGKRWR